MVVRLLDALLLATIVVAPWVLLAVALSAYRRILRRDGWWLALGGLLLWLLLAGMMAPLTRTPVAAMLHGQAKPTLAAYVASIRSGVAPLWTPQLGVGLPSLGYPWVGTMSPFTSLLLFFHDLDHGVNVLLLAHLVAAMVTMAVVSRDLGSSRLSSLLAGFAFVWTPWVFRKLGAEVQPMYLFGFAWIPLAWGLTLRLIRTRRALDAIRLGISLAFMAVTIATVFAVISFGIAFLLVAAALGDVRRRAWRRLQVFAGLLVIVAGSFFAAAAPEHLATLELFSLNEETRFVGKRIEGGWRDRDLSTREFLRLLLSNDVGAVLFPLHRPFAPFGVPFSPGDAVVLLGLLGLGAAFRDPDRRHRLRPGAHALLFLVVASVATHGPAHPVVVRTPLWGLAGTWPVAGAFLLTVIVIFFPPGFDLLRRWAVHGVRYLLRSAPRFLHLLPEAVSLFLVGLVAVELLWGVRYVFRAFRVPEPLRFDLRFSIPTVRIADFERMPHLKALEARTRGSELPVRVFCTGDRAVWPSPCFDFLVDRYGLELFGVGDISWVPPRWHWVVLSRLWGEWTGAFSPLLDRLLQLGSVSYVVATRTLGYPLIETVPWDPAPGDLELYSYFAQRGLGGGPWPEGWDNLLRIHAVPGTAPRAFFADPLLVTGTEDAQEVRVMDLLAGGKDFHHRKVVLLHNAPGLLRRLSDIPLLDAEAPPAAVNEALRGLPSSGRPVERVDVRLTLPRPGQWEAELTAPRRGALFLSTLFMPGLRATVNGRAAPVARADLFFAAVPVPAGPVTVRVVYAPGGILLAGILPLALAVGAGAVVLREVRRGEESFPTEVKLSATGVTRS